MLLSLMMRYPNLQRIKIFLAQIISGEPRKSCENTSSLLSLKKDVSDFTLPFLTHKYDYLISRSPNYTGEVIYRGANFVAQLFCDGMRRV